MEVTASSRCDWRKEPAVKSNKSASERKSTREEGTSRGSRKRPLSMDHSAGSDRYSQQPRMSAPVGYPTPYGGGGGGGYNSSQA